MVNMYHATVSPRRHPYPQVGLLMAQWTLVGYDGSAHVCEETVDAERSVPWAILLTVLTVGGTGYAFILALTFVQVCVGQDQGVG